MRPTTEPRSNTGKRARTGARARTVDAIPAGSARLSPTLVTVDAVALLAVGLVAASPLASAFGGWRWAMAIGGGLLLGLGTAMASRLARLGPWFTAGILVLAYLLVGPALAVPDQAIASVLPSPDALRTLATGVVEAWRDSLTLITPLGSSGNVLVVPLVLGLLTGVCAGLFLWRSRWPGVASVIVLVLLLVASGFGMSTASNTVTRGLVLGLGLLVWMRWRTMQGSRATWMRRAVVGVVTLAVVGGGVFAVSTLGDDMRRDVLRDHVEPPFDPRDYPSPLSKFRAYTDPLNLKGTKLFEVDGVEPGTLVRMATMDYFDGIVWNVTGGAGSGDASGTFVRFADSPGGGDTTEVTVTIDKLSGVWVPSVGQSTDVTVTDVDGDPDAERATTVLINEVTGTVAQVGGVLPGTTYTYETVLPEEHAAEDVAEAAREQGVSLEAPADVPETLAKLVETWTGEAAGAGGDGATAQVLAQRFHDDGYYSDGKPSGYTSAAGHGLKRIGDLVERPRAMVGNDEQYASALGVALQNLAIPARVVIGAEVPSGGTVTGDDIHAWVEVALEGVGWVPLTPTPPDDQILKEQQEEPDPVPQPYLPQPPQVPEEPREAEQAPPQGAGQDSGFDFWAFLVMLLGYAFTLLKIAALLSPLWGLWLAKRLRRRRRRTAGDPIVRLSGGWREVTDRARDLGVRLPVSNTRHQNGTVLSGRFPDANAPWLASVADRHVFAPGQPTPEEVEAYWADVGTALTRMRTAVPWWRRWVAVLSPASIGWRELGRRLRHTVVARTRRLAASVRRLMSTNKGSSA